MTTRPEQQLVSIVLPVYNEAENIENVIVEVSKSCKDLNHEIIVSEDGSVDGTPLILMDLVQSFDRLKIISSKARLGKAQAITEALRHVSGDIVVVMDPDGSHDPAEIHKLIKPIMQGQADLVIGSRFAKGGRAHLHIFNRFLSHIANLIVTLITSGRISDAFSGFRAYSRRVMNVVGGITDSKYYDFEIESVLKVSRVGFKVKEVPIRERTRYSFWYGKSKANLPARIFVNLIKLLVSDLITTTKKRMFLRW